jgi:hypothetical protein
MRHDCWIHVGKHLFLTVFLEAVLFGVSENHAFPVGWHKASSPATNEIAAITVGPEGFLAFTTNGLVLFSEGGNMWTQQAELGQTVQAAAYGRVGYVATGTQSSVSKNGKSWQRSGWLAGAVGSMASGNGAYVAQRFTFLETSTNGLRWSNTAPGPNDGFPPYFNAVTFNGEEFNAIGTNYFLTSRGGFNWEYFHTELSEGVSSLAGRNGILVAVTKDGKAIASTNRFSSWTAQRLSPYKLKTLAYGGGWFVSGGERNFIAASRDGNAWEELHLQELSSVSWAALCYGGGRFLLGASDGSIYYSDGLEAVQTNHAPVVVGPDASVSVVEHENVEIQFSANDSDRPEQKLRFSLLGDFPSGARIDKETGFFEWAPGEPDGDIPEKLFGLTVVVQDSGDPPLTGAFPFVIRVTETNEAPRIVQPMDFTVSDKFATQILFWDPDIPRQTVTPQLIEAPEGATMDTNGLITWVPTGEQSYRTHRFTVSVTEPGAQPLKDEKSFLVRVAPNADTRTVWTRVSPEPGWGGPGGFYTTSNELFEVNSDLIRTVDGESWGEFHPNVKGDITSIIRTPDAYLALTTTGVIATSADLINWQTQYQLTSGSSASMAYGNGKFVVCASSSGIYTSPDGTNWTQVLPPTQFKTRINFFKSSFVITGTGFNGANISSNWVAFSTNGVDWVESKLPQIDTYELRPALVTESELVLSGGTTLLATKDGENWEVFRLPDGVRTWHLDKVGPTFYSVIGYGTYYYSDDLQNWRAGALPTGTAVFDAAHFKDKWYLAAGDPEVALWETSALDKPWTRITKGTTQSIRETSFGNGRFVGITRRSASPYEGEIVLSTNGISWATEMPFRNQRYDTIVFDGDRFVVTAVESKNGRATSLFSRDGAAWQRSEVYGTNLTWTKMIFAGGKYLGMAGRRLADRIYASEDAVHWNAVFFSGNPKKFLRTITFGGGKIVALEYPELIVTSTDGSAWIERSLPADGRDIAFGRGLYVIIAGDRIMTSKDLSDWEVRSYVPYHYLSRVFFTGKYFLATPGAYDYDREYLWSEDGVNWFEESFDNGSFAQFVSNDEMIVAGGDGGFVAITPNEFKHPLLLPSLGKAESLSLYPNAFLESSTNLLNWISVTNNESPEKIEVKLRPTTDSRQFYRLRYAK